MAKKNKIIKVIKEPSEHLLKLIEDANEAIKETQYIAKEKILEVYYAARDEGYNKEDTRTLIKKRIVDVTDRWLQQVLPYEGKRNYSTTEIKRLTDDTNKPSHANDFASETINTTSTPEAEQVGLTQADVDDINKNKDEDETDDQTISTEIPPVTTPTIQEKIEKQTIENIQLEQEVKESQIQIETQKTELWRRKVKIEELELELEQTKNKLDEAREKIKELEEKLQDQDSKRFPFTLQPKDLHHECPKCHLTKDIPITGRVYKDSWVPFVDNIEAQKQQAQKWRT